MKNLDAYNLAANQYYARQDIKGLPLLSWDFYQDTLDQIYKHGSDVVLLSELAKKNKWDYPIPNQTELLESKQIVVVTNPLLDIVYATQNMFLMNGYRPAEVLGKKPKLFQGKGTCKSTLASIGLAVRNRIPFEATILNYRKNGTSYNCWIKGEPVFDSAGELVNFIAFEKEVA
ncbi:PAS domain-containing protein [Arenibacter sp. GZD96]|uniref:PAS domain-containing protein n=1 Tax=Aurantibrevibacter litoralis TaxID=3106030 RepID=UPI002AFE2ED5|nr:PAS domain-containing protein [Arenibacter sp. GZD-96]MEA1785668.1 PAS domain-containing protein [Arenibacter sp. GZD-96]